MFIHFFLLLLTAFLWFSAYFFHKKGETFLRFLNDNTERSYQVKIRRMVLFQIFAGFLAILCFFLNQPELDLIYLVVLLLSSAGVGLSLIKN